MKTDEEIIFLFKKYFLSKGTMTGIKEGKISFAGNVSYFPLRGEQSTKLPVSFETVTGNFNVYSTNLYSLEGCPGIVGGYFHCSNNHLENLSYGPKQVKGNYACANNKLTSLIGLPFSIHGNLTISYSPQLPLLPILKVKGCQKLKFVEDNSAADIINKYLGQGTRGMLSCAMELIKAGYRSNARL